MDILTPDLMAIKQKQNRTTNDFFIKMAEEKEGYFMYKDQPYLQVLHILGAIPKTVMKKTEDGLQKLKEGL